MWYMYKNKRGVSYRWELVDDTSLTYEQRIELIISQVSPIMSKEGFKIAEVLAIGSKDAMLEKLIPPDKKTSDYKRDRLIDVFNEYRKRILNDEHVPYAISLYEFLTGKEVQPNKRNRNIFRDLYGLRKGHMTFLSIEFYGTKFTPSGESEPFFSYLPLEFELKYEHIRKAVANLFDNIGEAEDQYNDLLVYIESFSVIGISDTWEI